MDCRQWARERPEWSREPAEEAFWRFVDQKWKDAINIAAAEPPAWGAGGGERRVAPQGAGPGMREAGKLAKAGAAAIHSTEAVGLRAEHGEGRRVCIFKGIMGCAGTHPPWFCRASGRLPAKEREKLIVDNKLCPFCLLHDKDKPCGKSKGQPQWHAQPMDARAGMRRNCTSSSRTSSTRKAASTYCKRTMDGRSPMGPGSWERREE